MRVGVWSVGLVRVMHVIDERVIIGVCVGCD